MCGPGDAPVTGVTVDIPGATIVYGGFTSSPNNDCTPPGGPTSLNLDGIQVDPTSDVDYHLTFCLPRPEELGDGPVSLDDTRLVQVMDVRAKLANGCRLDMDIATPPSGTIEMQGYCDGGLHAGGYAIALTGTVPGILTCDDEDGMPQEQPVTITLGGTAAVEAM